LTSHHTALDELVYVRERPGSDEGQQHLGNLVLHGCGKLIWIKAHGGDPWTV
jgi:hypothetical protein